MTQLSSPSGSSPPSLVIVMPALNEEAALGDHLRSLRCHPAIQALSVTRIIVVDNGSTDGTARVTREAGAEVVSEPRRGYGWACLAGVRAAVGADVVLLMDADGSDDPAGAAHVAALVLAGEADLAVGSRTCGTAERGALTPQQRAGNAVGALLLRMLYGLRVSDIGPTRAIRRDTLLRLDMREMGYGWSAEMLAKATRAGLRIRETPVDYHRRAGGKSKVAGTFRGTVKASIHILRTLSRYHRWQPGAATHAAQAVMGNRGSRDALFIIARLPVPGTTKTRLGGAIGHDAAAALYAAFLRDLGARFTRAAARDGYDLYWYYTAPSADDADEIAACVPSGSAYLRQPSGDFSERLLHGFRALAARGYERVIVVGSDSPHLPASRVADAFVALDTHDTVIGPARDGGYYLLGQRIAVSGLADLFTGMEMSTPRVCQETLDRARALDLSIATIPESFDVDEAGDLALLRAALQDAPSSDADPAPATLALLEASRGDAAATDSPSPPQRKGAQGGRTPVDASPLRTPPLVLRCLVLLALAAAAVPLYLRIRTVAGVYLGRPSLYFWPQLGVTVVAVAGCGLVLATRPAPARLGRYVELGLIVALGLAFRAVFFTAAPTLSHDAYRYVWDAHLVAYGVSPYTHALSDPALATLRDGIIWPRVNWRGSPTIYPPGAQLFYLLVNTVAPLNIQAMKLAMGACDLLCGALTLVLLRRHKLDPRRAIVYWWSPIPVLEFFYSAHVDALAAAEVLIALLVASQSWRGARTLAGTLIGLAALTKLYPLLFAFVLLRGPMPSSRNTPGATVPSFPFGLPVRPLRFMLAGLIRRNRDFLTGLGVALVLVPVPFLRLGLGSGGFLGTYFAQRFVDQGIVFRLITRIFVAAPIQLALQGLILSGACLLVARLYLHRLGSEAGILALSAAWIVVSPHVFPWYVGDLLPLLALYLRVPSLRTRSTTHLVFSPHRGGIPWTSNGDQGASVLATTLWLFALAMPFTYVIFVPGGDADLFPWFFVVPAALATAPLFVRRVAQAFHPIAGQPGSPEAAGFRPTSSMRRPLQAATTLPKE